MTATVVQGQIVAAVTGSPVPRIIQAPLVVAVSFAPPNSPPQVDQGSIIAAVRLFPVVRALEIFPAVDLPCIASCGSVPSFWRTT